MAQIIDIEEMLRLQDEVPLADVRTPAEYAHAHIPGAVNLPLFSNDERAEVGTLYKQRGRNKAVMRGLQFVGPKLYDLASAGKEAARYSKIMLHCWRGGMRSESMAWLLETAGLEVYLLEGGYKAYRQRAQKLFQEKWPLLVLSGYTGSGKTAILKEMQKRGEQVIDLEGMAHHKGSSFGSLGQGTQPSTEMFENLLSEVLAGFDKQKRIWIEDESRMVGHVAIPDALFSQMRQAKVIRILEPQEFRLKRLVDEYACFGKTLLTGALTRIEKRLGGLLFKKAMEALEQGDYRTVAEITLKYYDKAYLHGLGKRDQSLVHSVDCPHGDAAENAGIIIENIHS